MSWTQGKTVTTQQLSGKKAFLYCYYMVLWCCIGGDGGGGGSPLLLPCQRSTNSTTEVVEMEALNFVYEMACG